MKKARILIIEDEVLVGKDIKILLNNHNYEAVGIAVNEEQAYNQAIQYKPDLMLVDVHLRNGDSGIEAFKRIKSEIDIPCIFLTAYSDTKILEKAAFTNPQSYLIKPYQDKQLLVTINIVLQKQEIEKKLREQEIWLSSSFKSIAEGIITCDNSRNIKFINPFAKKITGWKEEDVIGKPLENFFRISCNENYVNFDKCMLNLLAPESESSCNKECNLLLEDKKTIPISGSGSEIRDQAGECLGFVFTFRDITERKKRSDALKMMKENLEIRVMERTTELESANQELESQKDELTNQSQNLREINSNLNQEISDHQKSIAKINFLNRTLRFAVPEALIITNNTGRIDYVNPAFEKVTGFLSNSVLGQKIPYLHKNLFVTKADSSQTKDDFRGNLLRKINSDQKFFKNLLFGVEHQFSAVYLEEMLRAFDNKEPWKKNIKNQRKTGEIYSEKTTAIQVANNEGKIENYIIIKDDISNEKRLEQQLIHSQKIEMLSRITAGISHDFNNILNIILSHADYLSSICMDETQQTSLEAISTSVERAAKLIRNLLSLGRNQETYKQPIQINIILNNTLQLIKNIFSKNHEIVKKFSLDNWYIYADPSQMEQVITNICINAKDAMQDGGKLIVQTEIVTFDNEAIFTNTTLKPGKYILVSFRDSGTGISREDLIHIFDPFYSTKVSKKGSGLGLSMVSRIVTGHNGGISVKSNPGQGTAFNLYFPISDMKQNEKVKKDKPESHPHAKPLDILVVDDEETVIKMLINRLKNENFQCISAFNGKEALEIFKSQREAIDLIISDIVMPEMDGITLLKEIKRIDSNFPVIILTGSPISKNEKQYLTEHSVDILNKPIEFSQLLWRINSLEITPSSKHLKPMQNDSEPNQLTEQIVGTDSQMLFEKDPNSIIFPQYLSNQEINNLETLVENFFKDIADGNITINMLKIEEFTLPHEKIFLRIIVLARKYNKKLIFKATENIINTIKEHGYSVKFN
ncbi:MAG: response regulator [Candidatus Cloacimonadota bacterium]|nr:response regulator [Candidatus Cloacimonadota bacterium]